MSKETQIPFIENTHKGDHGHSPAPAPYHSRTPLHTLQQAFLDLRLTMFIHYNMATYQDLEWGSDRGPVDIFNPTNLDTDQWADAAIAAGMTGAFLTTKVLDLPLEVSMPF